MLTALCDQTMTLRSHAKVHIACPPSRPGRTQSMTTKHMNPTRVTICLLTTAAAALVAALPASRAADADSIVARGGAIQVDVNEVRSLIASLPDGTRQAVLAKPGSLEQLVRQDILERSLLKDAQAASFATAPGTASTLQSVHDEALTRLWLASKAAVPTGFPNESQIQAAYELLQKNAPYEYHLEQIFIAAPDGGDPQTLGAALRKAVDVQKLIATGSFEQIARERSEDTASAAKGGDLGFLPGAKLMPDIRAAVASLTPGETAGPIKTSAGLHFLKLIERRRIAIPPLATVHAKIAAALRAQRAQQLEQAYVQQVAAKLDITVDQIELAKLQSQLNQ
jgi:parvulin-like peptidyl-prolyl isomerase